MNTRLLSCLVPQVSVLYSAFSRELFKKALRRNIKHLLQRRRRQDTFSSRSKIAASNASEYVQMAT